jgi:hypothetical protein
VAADTVLHELFAQVVSTDHYSQLETGPVVSREPFGQLISRSAMAYEALYTDDQGSFAMLGNIWVGVRHDGRVLTMTAETTPPGDFDSHYTSNFFPIYEPIWTSFGAGSLP